MTNRRGFEAKAAVIGAALATLLSTGSGPWAQASPDAKSLYERLGRYDTIAATVDELLRRMLADASLAPILTRQTPDTRARLRQLTVDQVCAATGGPCVFSGLSRQATLAGLSLTKEQWEATASHLSAALESLKVAAPEREELVATVSRLQAGGKGTTATASAPPVRVGAVTAGASTLGPDALRACLGKPQESGPCLDQLFRGFLQTNSTPDALALINKYEETSPDLRLQCHVIVHSLGRQTMVVKRTIKDAFASCDHTCHSGCYHGVMERFLVGDEEPAPAHVAHDHGATHNHAAAGHSHGPAPIARTKLQARVAAACDPQESERIRFQCVHGLGHAVMFFTDYRLREALALCDTLPDAWSQTSCHGGVFMENLFASNRDKRDVSPTDLHYPCNYVQARYRTQCYLMQTWRMGEMGLGTERLFEECRKAGPNRLDCATSIGRDLSNEARTKNPRWAAERCELGRLDEIRACVQGVIYALIENTWDGRYALPFCASLRDRGDGEVCFERSVRYLTHVYEKSTDEIRLECATRLTFPEACLNATGS